MRQPIKLVIKNGDIRKDGTSLIYVQYCFSSQKRVLLSTDISIPANYWNKKTGSILTSLPTKYGDPKSLESDLREQLRRAEQIVDYAFHNNTEPVRFLKRYFKERDISYQQHVDFNKDVKDVFYQIDPFINGKMGLVSKETIDVFRQMKNHLKAFQSQQKIVLTFDSFGVDFYQKFVKFLTYDYPVLRRNKPTVITPLQEDARKILIDKYKMKLPEVSEAKFNHYIKEVVRLAGINQPVAITHRKGNILEEEIRPKFALVSSHIGRRSFCTNEYLAGTPADLIMTVSGHRSEKAFRRYIKADQLQKANLVKKLWEARPCL